MDPEVCSALNAAQDAGAASFTFTRFKNSYVVDLDSVPMTQTNTRTQVTRQVQRVPTPAAACRIRPAKPDGGPRRGAGAGAGAGAGVVEGSAACGSVEALFTPGQWLTMAGGPAAPFFNGRLEVPTRVGGWSGLRTRSVCV